MIPKKVHYIWLGGKRIPSLTRCCINSWYSNLANYEIVEWNEQSLNIKALRRDNRFLDTCLRLKLWAFASDYLRLYVLFNNGGIYLDTDVQVLRSYDDLLSAEMFVGLEANEFIGTGVIGASKYNPIIKRLLDFYEEEIWNVDFINNPIIFKYLLENEPELFKGCLVLPEDCFSPFNPSANCRYPFQTSNTYAIHWYSGNWNMSRKGYVFSNTKHIHNPFVKFFASLRKTISYEVKSHL